MGYLRKSVVVEEGRIEAWLAFTDVFHVASNPSNLAFIQSRDGYLLRMQDADFGDLIFFGRLVRLNACT